MRLTDHRIRNRAVLTDSLGVAWLVEAPAVIAARQSYLPVISR